MKLELFVLHRQGRAAWYYTGIPTCGTCGNTASYGFYLSNWNTHDLRHGFVCHACGIEWQKMNTRSQEYRPVLVVSDAPRGAIPVLPEHHGFQESNVPDVFELRAERTINRAWRSRDKEYSFDGPGPLTIGKSEEELQREIEWKNDEMALLEFHADERNILLPEHQKKLLEAHK